MKYEHIDLYLFFYIKIVKLISKFIHQGEFTSCISDGITVPNLNGGVVQGIWASVMYGIKLMKGCSWFCMPCYYIWYFVDIYEICIYDNDQSRCVTINEECNWLHDDLDMHGGLLISFQ